MERAARATCERLVRDQEEPFGSTSIYAQWRVMRGAREAGVIVLLDGQGADELFGGYAGSDGWALAQPGPARRGGRRTAERPGLARPFAVAYARRTRPGSARARHHLRRAASPYVDRDGGAMRQATAAAARPRVGATVHRCGARCLTQTFRTSLPQLCRFADRNSMAHSVEVRLPFLDRRVAEFALLAGRAHALARRRPQAGLLRESVRGASRRRCSTGGTRCGTRPPQARWFGSPSRAARGSPRSC